MVAAFCVVMVLLGSPNPSASQELEDLVERLSQSVLTITTFGVDGEPYADGTGLVIRDGSAVLTALHVMENAFTALAHTRDGTPVEVGRPLRESWPDDLIELRIRLPGDGAHESAVFANRVPRPGEEVLVIGNPMGVGLTVTQGLVSGISDSGRAPQGLIRISAATHPGSSGGPVFDRHGEVVGVLLSGFEETETLNFAASVTATEGLSHVWLQSLAEWSGYFLHYRIRSGDSLWTIARRFGITIEWLRHANGVLDGTDRIRADQVVRVPVRSHRLRAGQTLSQLSSWYNVKVQQFASANHLNNPDHVEDGQRLVVPSHLIPIYEVRAGDTLLAIAGKLGTTVDALKAANRLRTDVIREGQILAVPAW